MVSRNSLLENDPTGNEPDIACPVLPITGAMMCTYFKSRENKFGEPLVLSPEVFIERMTRFEVIDMDDWRRRHPTILPEDLANEAKAGGAIVLALTREGRKTRGMALWENAIALDVEREDREDSVLPPPFETVKARVRALGVSFVMHTTFSHTPEEPRYRVYMWLQEPWAVWRTRAKRRALVEYVTMQLGIPAPALDGPASSGRVRLLYMPRCPQDGPAPEHDSEIVEDGDTGRLIGLDAGALVDSVPYDDEPVPEDAERAGAVEHMAAVASTAPVLPSAPEDVRRWMIVARNTLATMPQEGSRAPDREAWFLIGMSLYRAFGEDGRALFQEFSERHSSHDDRNFDRAWNSLDPTEHPRDLRAVRHITARAFAVGVHPWNDGPGMARLREALAALPPSRLFPRITDAARRRAERANQQRLEARALLVRLSAGRTPVEAEDGIEHVLAERVREELPRLPVALFRRGDKGLCYVRDTYEYRLYDNDGNAIERQGIGIEMVDAPWLAEHLSARLQFIKTKYGKPVGVNVPRNIIDMVMLSPGTTVPVLSGIITTPTMRPDGSLLTANGYDAATGFYLKSDLVVSVPERPTRIDALAALGVLRGLLTEFPFAGRVESTVSVNEAVALSLMMSVILRPAFPSMPGTLISAAGMNSGKSYLMKLVGLLSQGRVMPVASWDNKEENEKQIRSLLRGGAPILAFDNANRATIGGQVLCSVLSEPVVTFRILSETTNMTVPTDGLTVIVNGNHANVGEDATRRFVNCMLVRDDDDLVRRFGFDPEAAILADRGKYVAAVLTIARAFVLAARPVRLDLQSYTAWARLVPSSLVWLGLPSVVDTVEANVADDPERDKAATVAALIRDTMGEGRFKVNAFVAAVVALGMDDGLALAGAVGATARGVVGVLDPRTLARPVGDFLRHYMSDKVITLTDGAASTPQAWRLSKVAGGGQHPVIWQLWRVSRPS